MNMIITFIAFYIIIGTSINIGCIDSTIAGFERNGINNQASQLKWIMILVFIWPVTIYKVIKNILSK